MLHKRFPGQRSAAWRWNEHVAEVCQAYGFESYEGSAVYRRAVEKAYMSTRIDDIIAIADAKFIDGFGDNLKEHFKLKMDGPHGQARPGTWFYLKRDILVDEDGVDILPNAKRIPKLVELLGTEERRGKTNAASWEL